MRGGDDGCTTEGGRTRRLRHGAAGLGYGQTFLLIFGFLLTSGLIFLFGVWVGRDVAERRLAQEERVVRAPIPVQPTPKEEEKAGDVDLAFYQKLKEKAEQRLQETAAASGSPSPARPARAADVAAAPAPAAATATRSTARPTAAAEKATPRPTPAAKATPEAYHDEWADAGWTVQVNATTSSDEAFALARTLKAKGYDAYTVQAPMRGQTWYRVRVGRFASREKAKETEARLKHDGMENAYIAPQ